MSKKYLQPGKTMDWYNGTGADCVSGQFVKVGERMGVCAVDIASTKTGSVDLEEVHECPKTTGEAWTQGDKLFWVAGTSKLSKTATANTWAGFAFKDAASDDATGAVKLEPLPGKALVVAAHGAPAVVATVFTGAATAGGATPSDANVNTAIDAHAAEAKTALDLKADNADLISVAAKLDDVIAKLKAAGLMANA